MRKQIYHLVSKSTKLPLCKLGFLRVLCDETCGQESLTMAKRATRRINAKGYDFIPVKGPCPYAAQVPRHTW
jgi:hypothetical protein